MKKITIDDRVHKMNVVCVTKSRKDAHSIYHLPITGELEVFHTYTKSPGLPVKFVKTMVRFQGKEYAVACIGTGLDGSAVVIGILKTDDYHDCWSLYTDTPAGHVKESRFGSEVTYSKTPEEIRAIAQRDIDWAEKNNDESIRLRQSFPTAR